MLLVEFDAGDKDAALTVLQRIDFKSLQHFEYLPVLKIAIDRKAWELVIEMIERLLKFINTDKEILVLKADQFHAYKELGNHLKAIELGESILHNNDAVKLLVEDKNFEYIYGITCSLLLDRNENERALCIVDSLSAFKTFSEFEMHLEAQVFISNNFPDKALESIVQTFSRLNPPTGKQFGLIYLHLNSISNLSKREIESNKTITDNCFVKLSTSDDWYYIGEGACLDATRVTSNDNNYLNFIGKSLGNSINLGAKYSGVPLSRIEYILPIENYIIIRSSYYFQKYSVEGRWDVAKAINLSVDNDKMELSNFLSMMEEMRQSSLHNLNIYINNPMPLALLATGEGSLPGAVSLIMQEEKGFVNFSTGELKEFNEQKNVAKRIIGGSNFYIDGTSALILCESNLLQLFYSSLPGMLIPLSVIKMLEKMSSRFRLIPGNSLSVHYAQGQLSKAHISDSERREILSIILGNITLLESNPGKLVPISESNKRDEKIEKGILPEVSDACILAQKDGEIVLTEDFQYLQANALVTKKPLPEYCSVFALITVLLEENMIPFDQFLRLYAYESSYRFRFLQVNSQMLNQAILGKGPIYSYNPDNLKYYNLKLVLSPEYGADFETVVNVLARFFSDIIQDDSIIPNYAIEVVNKVFDELPAIYQNRSFRTLLIDRSTQMVYRSTSLIQSKVTINKIETLKGIYLANMLMN